MDIPIAEKLIPNLLTMAAQLCATGVIYLLYMKFLQEPVSKYLDARAEKMESDLKDAQASKESSHKILEETKETQRELLQKSKVLEEQMRLSAMKERQDIIDSAQDEIQAQRARNQAMLEEERESLLKAQNQQVLDMALLLNEKVLLKQEFNHDSALDDFAKALEEIHD